MFTKVEAAALANAIRATLERVPGGFHSHVGVRNHAAEGAARELESIVDQLSPH